MASQDFNCASFVASAKLILAHKELDYAKSIGEKSFSLLYTEAMISRNKEIVQRANLELDKVCTMPIEKQKRFIAINRNDSGQNLQVAEVSSQPSKIDM